MIERHARGATARFDRERERAVDEQLVGRGVTDARVVAAIGRMPRHLLVDAAQEVRPDGDHPLPIGLDRTISPPFTAARMTELLALTGCEKVVEVGSSS